MCSNLLTVRINITNLDWFCALICYDFFLILFITIKAEIALILQCVSINTPLSWPKKDIFYTSLILSHHHSHTHLLFYLSFKKKYIKGGRKRRKHSLHSLFVSHYYPHKPISFLSLLKKKQKNIRKGDKE